MNAMINLAKKYRQTLFFFVILFSAFQSLAQKSADPKLDKMPAALETDLPER